MIGGYADVHFAFIHPTPDEAPRTGLPGRGKHAALDLRNKRGNMYVYAVNICRLLHGDAAPEDTAPWKTRIV
jgi:hypothetical protein